MKNNLFKIFNVEKSDNLSEKGTAIVIALLILALLMAFVAFAITRTTSETLASGNDAAESRAYAASEASMEVMTRNFDKIFEEKLSPAPDDLQHVQDQTPTGFDTGYDFQQNITQVGATQTVVLSGQLYQGLNAIRDAWQIDTTATEKATGVQVQLRRQFFNNRIPIFQFGIFYDDDLEFHPGPRFDFGGRVHSNSNIFMMAATGLYFSSRVTAAGQVMTDVARNNRPYTGWGENVFIKDGSGTYVQLKHDMGSLLKNPTNGTPYFQNAGDPVHYNADMPAVYNSTGWNANKALFDDNLLADQKRLDLPLVIASRINGSALDYVELIKRGVNVGDLYNDVGVVKPVTAASTRLDTSVTSHERYANKPGIRISLADSKAKLPGCASGTGLTPVSGVCGKRLDGDATGDSAASFTDPRGYQPLAMGDGYQATRVNGARLGTSGSANGRQVWIKIETMRVDPVTDAVETKDITADILSFGVTEAAPNFGGTFQISPTTYYNTYATDGNTKYTDQRSIIKLQRFTMPGVQITSPDTTWMTSETWNGGTTYYNSVLTRDCGTSNWNSCLPLDSAFNDDPAHEKLVNFSSGGVTHKRKIVPFPIEMFDTREGLYNDDITPTDATVYGSNVPWAGVMSMLDIDVANLKDFLDGDYNAVMPAGTKTVFSTANSRGLRNTDIWNANGWVLYVSDRRGDADFDGEYDMEDVYGNNDGIKQQGEDVNNSGTLDTDYSNEAAKYTKDGLVSISLPTTSLPATLNSYGSPAMAASVDTSYFRRGVRLINGHLLPGNYNAATPANTQGFTVASENGVYVLGNYNADSVSTHGTPTPSTDFQPQDNRDIPASIVSDAITVLSNSWSDTRSFRYPFTLNQRQASETTVRFAMLAGDTRSSGEATPNQGGSDPRLSGGVHNFKRFLEDWGGDYLNYSGSLINLYNSRNNNGSFKCCNKVYSPPNRNWVFDASFLDPNRLPPGTPFFQSIQLTGFQRVN